MNEDQLQMPKAPSGGLADAERNLPADGRLAAGSGPSADADGALTAAEIAARLAAEEAEDERRLTSHNAQTAKHFAKAAGQVAASAVLATSLTAALTEPPRADLIQLPEPTPIVQMYTPYADEIEPAENDEDDTESNKWRRLLKLLRYLAVALLMAASVAFGALKGCAGCTAGMLLPTAQQEEQDEGATQCEAETQAQGETQGEQGDAQEEAAPLDEAA